MYAAVFGAYAHAYDLGVVHHHRFALHRDGQMLTIDGRRRFDFLQILCGDSAGHDVIGKDGLELISIIIAGDRNSYDMTSKEGNLMKDIYDFTNDRCRHVVLITQANIFFRTYKPGFKRMDREMRELWGVISENSDEKIKNIWNQILEDKKFNSQDLETELVGIFKKSLEGDKSE